ncbi:flippase-like domain-containing protein [Pyrococcus yayanosii]|uniref:Integral membrane protein n=1 Tax=Pyrococcus yayanosii (strain CH1 / JCM 16557) TaxID=529709 RepID=F8AGU2_PYRYC|nr:flippase-like domain-containing protein [Pyrococcus yayanosii]AEH25228.1 hypothetical protein PYCH_15620 [Pyrococcus yayanosii CH1]
MKRKVTLILGLAILLGLLWWAGIGETMDILKGAQPSYFLLAAGMQAIALLAWAVRWRTFLRRAGVHVDFLRVLEGVMIGIFVNNLTPGARTGGEPAKAYFISKRSNGSYPQVFATVMADRVLDVIPVVVFMFLAFNYALKLRIGLLLTVLIVSIVLIIIALSLTLAFSVHEGAAVRLLMFIARLVKRISPAKLSEADDVIEGKLRRAISEFKRTLRELGKDKGGLIISLLWSFTLWSASVLRTYFVFLSIGYEVPLAYVLLVQMAAMAIAMMSVIPGGLGVNEAVLSALFLALGIEKSIAVSATILDRLISFWIPTLIGGVLTLRQGAPH